MAVKAGEVFRKTCLATTWHGKRGVNGDGSQRRTSVGGDAQAAGY